MSSKIKSMVLTAVLASLITVMTFVPFTGYITYGGIAITTIHIPVIIGAVVLGKRGGLILGLVWGVTGLIKATTTGTPEALIFMDPRISVLPRIIVGFTVGLCSDLLKEKVTKIEYTVGLAVLGTILNTILVLSAIYMWGLDNVFNVGESILKVFSVLVSLNGVIELAIAVFIVPIIVTSLRIAGYTSIK